MGRVLLRRAGDLLFVSFGVSIVSFLMIRLIPGDAVQLMLGANAEVTQSQIDTLRHELGLDQSFLRQYIVWIGRVLHGDFGTSLTTGRPVLAHRELANALSAILRPRAITRVRRTTERTASRLWSTSTIV